MANVSINPQVAGAGAMILIAGIMATGPTGNTLLIGEILALLGGLLWLGGAFQG